jgi:hypothetical protein
MPRKAQAISGVSEKNEGSGVWYIRYRLNGELGRKMIGTRKQAGDYLNKVRHIRASRGWIPTTATEPARAATDTKDDLQGSYSVIFAMVLLSKSGMCIRRTR